MLQLSSLSPGQTKEDATLGAGKHFKSPELSELRQLCCGYPNQERGKFVSRLLLLLAGKRDMRLTEMCSILLGVAVKCITNTECEQLVGCS